MSREEIEAMFSLNELKQTRFYREAFEEGKQEGIKEAKRQGRLEAQLEAVPRLLTLGLTVEQIAQALGLSVQEVRQAAQQQSSNQ